MSEQDIEKIAGRYFLQIRSLKREIAAIIAWIEGYRESSRVLDRELNEALHADGALTLVLSEKPELKALNSLSNYPASELKRMIQDLHEKRQVLREKEKLLLEMN